MSEEIEGLKNILSRYSLSDPNYVEKLLKEKHILVHSFHFENEGLSGFSFIADVNEKTAYHATLTVNQRFIHIESKKSHNIDKGDNKMSEYLVFLNGKIVGTIEARTSNSAINKSHRLVKNILKGKLDFKNHIITREKLN